MEFEVNALLRPYIYNDMLELVKRVDLKPYSNKTVIVTGGAKPLGMYISCALLINNDLNCARTKVIAVDADDKIFERYGKLTYRDDIDFIKSTDYSYLGTEKADFVIHTQSIEQLQIFDAVINLLNFIERNNACSVLALSSDIYGDVFNGKRKISEADIYGYADCSKPEMFKVQSERMFHSLAVKLARDKSADIKLAVIADVYSAGFERYNDIFNNVKGKSNVLVEQNEFPQSVIYVSDAAAAIFKILQNGKAGDIYNAACDDILSPLILAEKCSEYIYGGELKVVYKGKEASLSYLSPNLKIFDNTKLKALGYSAQVDLRSGIVRTLNIMAEKGGEA